ncbi:heme utilization or adhesion related exo protein [Bifidobacterium cuniculi]|uniref:Heme utilization or adhesion related exo protein n=2 Tax=Bifidobacterium cuniculi TaxID=1688 RepID=A0A087AII6_9BIFI|nr:heme utilization or adhesion related exo protein [Bifidobacterium cuniculi]
MSEVPSWRTPPTVASGVAVHDWPCASLPSPAWLPASASPAWPPCVGDWQVSKPLTRRVSVTYPTALDGFTINGVAVSAHNAVEMPADGSAVFVAYPGVYQVGIGESKLLSAKTVTVSTADGDGSHELWVEATDELVAALQEQVDAKVDECAKEKGTSPYGCPFRAYTYSTIRNFAWTVSQYPKVTRNVSVQDGTFTTYGGTMKYTYEEKRSSGWTPDNGSSEIGAMPGTFDIDGDTVHVDFDTSGF